MKAMMIAGAMVLALAGTAEAQVDAQKAEALAKDANCGKCHLMDKKRKGPSYKDIAAKHKGDKNAANTILTNLAADEDHAKLKLKGDDLKLVVNWILSL